MKISNEIWIIFTNINYAHDVGADIICKCHNSFFISLYTSEQNSVSSHMFWAPTVQVPLWSFLHYL